jgi:lysozyme
MRVSEQCLAMLKKHEGVRYKPYKCPAGLWTVGVGHLIGDGRTLPAEWNRSFSTDEIDSILQADLRRFERGVLRLCPRILNQGQFDALVSFAFNLGLGALQRSTLRMKHNRGQYHSVPKEFLKWSKAGGKVLRGLLRRREDEARLYAKGY